MDQARHVDARHASNKSQQPVRRPPADPQKKIICRLASENTHEAGNTMHDPGHLYLKIL